MVLEGMLKGIELSGFKIESISDDKIIFSGENKEMFERAKDAFLKRFNIKIELIND